ncbi:MAG: NUDIX hydrolase [Puniceicoccales bacterium]|jgi:8-oxo-dGTP pyrophosphatase MutT (NUDIX family)|nr:NUDIX hydrolase [Puniceicoccales bacterium]
MKDNEIWTNVLIAPTAICYHAESDSVLFLRPSEPLLNWCLPGGKAHYGENLEAAIRREVFEETGLSPERFFAVDTWQGQNAKYEDIPLVSVTYLCRAPTREVTLSEEHGTFVWKPVREFDDFQPHTGGFNLKTIALHIAHLRDYL